jgi:hypothetical protein
MSSDSLVPKTITISLPDSHWIILPYRVGFITPKSTETDLINLYGKSNIKRAKIGLGEGFTIEGTEIFPKQSNMADIQWKTEFSQPERITISQSKTQWKTKEGITIGTTLDEIEKLNGRPFKLTGFEWDYPGRSVSWEGGKISKTIQIDFKITIELPLEKYRKVLGDGPFSSSNAFMKEMKLVVDKIAVNW